MESGGMARYLLDTTALIDFSKDREPARSRILRMIESGDELGVCAVNIAEFYAGLPPERWTVWDDFLSALQYWEITWGTARQAGRFRYDFARRGIALSTADTLVAAVAWERGATILTDNVEDYPMDEVRVLSLRS